MSLVNGNARVMRRAIRILMQSPIYTRMPLAERKILVKKLYAQMEVSWESTSSQVHDSAPLTASTVEDIPSHTAYLTLDLH